MIKLKLTESEVADLVYAIQWAWQDMPRRRGETIARLQALEAKIKETQ